MIMSKIPKPKTDNSKDPAKKRRITSGDTCDVSREDGAPNPSHSKKAIRRRTGKSTIGMPKKKATLLDKLIDKEKGAEDLGESLSPLCKGGKPVVDEKSADKKDKPKDKAGINKVDEQSADKKDKPKDKSGIKKIDEQSTGQERTLDEKSALKKEKEKTAVKKEKRKDRPGDEKSGFKKDKRQDRTVEDRTIEGKTTDNNYNEELLNNMSKALTFHSWFHGLMPRDEIEELLVKDGDFLVRKTEVARQVRYAVTVMYNGRIRHVLLKYKDDMWSLRDLKRATVTELIETYVNEKIPLMLDGTVIINAVPRPPFYILHEHIELKNRLGGGAFGDVYKANMKNKDGSVTPVAVKQLKGAMLKKQRSEFIKEARLMRRFDHPNIIKIYGVAPQEEPILIVLELAANGSLTSKLKDNPDIDKETLVRYATEACRGMCYLAGQRVIHRDIAARNCLLGAQDEVKISDFGMSVADKSVLKLDKLNKMPVRWLSPEIMRKGEFTTKSDVWAFGVLVWEIFSRCKSAPFPEMTNRQAKEKILSGQPPLDAPDESPELIKNILTLCFIQNPDERPDFEGIFKILAPKETPPPKLSD